MELREALAHDGAVVIPVLVNGATPAGAGRPARRPEAARRPAGPGPARRSLGRRRRHLAARLRTTLGIRRGRCGRRNRRHGTGRGSALGPTTSDRGGTLRSCASARARDSTRLERPPHACRGRAGAAGDCPLAFRFAPDGTAAQVWYDAGWCDFKGTAFGDCVLERLRSGSTSRRSTTSTPSRSDSMCAWRRAGGDHWRMISGESPVSGTSPYGFSLTHSLTCAVNTARLPLTASPHQSLTPARPGLYVPEGVGRCHEAYDAPEGVGRYNEAHHGSRARGLTTVLAAVALLVAMAGSAAAQCGGTQLCAPGAGDCTVNAACTITLPSGGLTIDLGSRRLVDHQRRSPSTVPQAVASSSRPATS